ncbi:MAG: hypothetical protein AB1716_06250 [Planctomycetota bacterium]
MHASFRWVALVCACAEFCGAADLISDLPLSGNLMDRVTGQPARFSRASIAFTKLGQEVVLDTPRYEQYAVAAGFEWRLETRPYELVPITVAGGELFATDTRWYVYATRNGTDFEYRGQTPVWIERCTAGWPTPGGALLISGRSQPDNINRIYRSADGGRTYTEVLALPRDNYAWHWNCGWVGGALFISEYDWGPGFTGDREVGRIYRSMDDGCTWQRLDSCPPPPRPTWHNHQTLGDPYRQHIYQAIGDQAPRIMRSRDYGDTWEFVHDFYMGVSGVARPEAIYWGHDGMGGSPVERYDPVTDTWTRPLDPWNGYRGSPPSWRQGNSYALFEHAGALYAPYALYINDIWATVDGSHWAFLRAFNPDDRGTYHVAGACGGWIHALFQQGWAEHNLHLQWRPGRLATLTGLRIEPPVANLLNTAQLSSLEEGVGGWYNSSLATITWDTQNAFHGGASLAFTNPNAGENCLILSPSLPSLPVGTVVQGQIRFRGDESGLWVALYDRANAIYGPYLQSSAANEWVLARPEFTVTQPVNALCFLVKGTSPRPTPARVCVDGLQMSVTDSGETWQLGGQPRAGEVLRHTLAYPETWSDFLCVRPSFDSNAVHPGWRTLKAWVQDPNNYVLLAFSPVTTRFLLAEVLDREVYLRAESAPALFWRWRNFRIGSRSSPAGCEFHVKIGSGDAELTGAGPPLTVRPTEVWIGGSPWGNDQAPGVYALSRTFSGELSQEEFARELEYLPVTPRLGDLNCDGELNFCDINPFVLALADPAGYAAQYPQCDRMLADINRDGLVDFNDINPFVWLLCGSAAP